MASSNKRTWLWVIAGVFGTIFLFFVLLIGSAVYMFRTHVRNESNIESTTAERRFDEQRARFKGQQPLVEFTGDQYGDDDATVHRPAPDAPRVKINAVRVLIYDMRNSHLIHVEVPGWFIRMMPESRFDGFQGSEEIRRHRITIEDLERHGYGLVVDGHNPNTRILIWTE